MIGTTVTFTKKIEDGFDALNNPEWREIEIIIADCLIAPITEPANTREQQAYDQSRDQVRVHIPKAAAGADVSGSTFVFGNKTFTVDSDSVDFMDENTPTRWGRYFRAELINKPSTQLSGFGNTEFGVTPFGV